MCTNAEMRAGLRPIEPSDLNTGGLKNKKEMIKELSAYQLNTAGLKEDLQSRLREHAKMVRPT
jgi:hypothetical protein